jgi:hypothetical protein
MENPFVYLVRIAVPAHSVVTPQINISSEQDFELHEIRGNVQAQGAILISISYANGTQWSNTSFDSATISAGANANNKVMTPVPIMIPRNTQINVALENTTAAPITYELQMWGRKL